MAGFNLRGLIRSERADQHAKDRCGMIRITHQAR